MVKISKTNPKNNRNLNKNDRFLKNAGKIFITLFYVIFNNKKRPNFFPGFDKIFPNKKEAKSLFFI